MTTVTALETQAGQVLDQSYAQFKQAQLALGKEQTFANAAQIFTVGEIAAATRQYLFDEEIAQQDDQVARPGITDHVSTGTKWRILEVELYG